jgi:hypothetical protein
VATPGSGYLLGLSALVEGRVEFVVVGVGGINFYARSPAQAFATLDLDVLLEPRVPNLGAALRALSEEGYGFEAGGEPFLEIEDETILGRIVSRGASLSSRHEVAGQLDLTYIPHFSAATSRLFFVGGGISSGRRSPARRGG